MQEPKILRDEKAGKKKPNNWKGHKEDSLLLSDSYQRLKESNKAFRVSLCASSLVFERYIDGTRKLKAAKFCQVRLCPMCAWRRSLKIFGQVSKVMDYITAGNDFRYLFLTLTVKNVPGAELSGELDALFAAFKKLTERKEFKKISKGWFRCLEVTHKWENGDDYHPHLHMIIAVSPSYFTSGGTGYLTHQRWMDLWRSCAGLDYDPWVFIEKVKPKDGSGDGTIDYGKTVAEVAKYTVKAADFIVKPPNEYSPYNERVKEWAEKQMDEVVSVLDKALSNRRLVAFGGAMRDAHKKLNLDNPEDGELVNTDNEERIRPDLSFVLEKYNWHPGYKNYVLVQKDEI